MDGLVNVVGGCCGTTPEHIRLLSSFSQEFSGALKFVNPIESFIFPSKHELTHHQIFYYESSKSKQRRQKYYLLYLYYIYNIY